MPSKTLIAAILAVPATIGSISAAWTPMANAFEKTQEVLKAGESIAEVRVDMQQVQSRQTELVTGYKIMQQEQLQQGETVRRTEAKVDRLIEIMLERAQ